MQPDIAAPLPYRCLHLVTQCPAADQGRKVCNNPTCPGDRYYVAYFGYGHVVLIQALLSRN